MATNTSMQDFSTKNVKQLQEYLKHRGVITSNTRKAQLISLCEAASLLNIEVDPDGINEDKSINIRDKLTTEDGLKLKIPFLCDTTDDLSILPRVAIVDLYNYLRTCNDFDHASMRDVEKMEGHQMFIDEYVQFISPGTFAESDKYCFVIAHVKPRTNDKDPISKLPYYKLWLVF